MFLLFIMGSISVQTLRKCSFIDTNQHSVLPFVRYLVIEIGNSFGEGDDWSIESKHLIINSKILFRNFVMLYLGQGCLP